MDSPQPFQKPTVPHYHSTPELKAPLPTPAGFYDPTSPFFGRFIRHPQPSYPYTSVPRSTSYVQDSPVTSTENVGNNNHTFNDSNGISSLLFRLWHPHAFSALVYNRHYVSGDPSRATWIMNITIVIS